MGERSDTWKIKVRFLSADDLLTIHEQLAGEASRLTHVTALSLAAAAPVQRLARAKDIYELAATLAIAVAKRRPFRSGNARTALGAALIFLDANGVTPEVDIDEMARVLKDRRGERLLAEYLRSS